MTLWAMLCSLRFFPGLLEYRDSKNCTAVVRMIGAPQFSVANAGLMFEFENWTDNPLFYFDIKRGFHAALNNVLAEGGMPKGVIIDLILPHKAIEQDIKKIMGFIGGLAKDARVEITGGDTEVTVNVLSPVVVITAIGGRMEATGEVNIHADMDIVMAGYAGVCILKSLTDSGMMAGGSLSALYNLPHPVTHTRRLLNCFEKPRELFLFY